MRVWRQLMYSTVPSMALSGLRIHSPTLNGPVQVDRQAAEEVGQQVLGRETHRDAADAAQRQQAGDLEAQRLRAR